MPEWPNCIRVQKQHKHVLRNICETQRKTVNASETDWCFPLKLDHDEVKTPQTKYIMMSSFIVVAQCKQLSLATIRCHYL